jgi:hypothetical protein
MSTAYNLLRRFKKERNGGGGWKLVDPTEDVDDSEVEIEERVCQINNIVDQYEFSILSSMTFMICANIAKMINLAYLISAC